MARKNNNDTADPEWESMLEIAKAQQQSWYEMLPEWTIFDECHFQYLKLKIAMALFGLPESDSMEVTQYVAGNSQTEVNTNDFTRQFEYTDQQQQIIDTIYEQICTHGKGYMDCDNSICYAVMYNIFFRTKNETVPNQTDKETKEANDKTKFEEDKDIKTSTTPIFKVQKSIKKTEERNCVKPNGKPGTVKKVVIVTEVWFFDIQGRVYKSWESYKSDNTLPACTMVLPWDGFYQPDRDCLLTEDISTVMLEIVNSPACSMSNFIRNIGDVGSTVASVVGMGIGIATMFTPLGPVAAGIGLATIGAGGLWTVGRSAEHLVDRSMHEESINVTDKRALGAWIGIAGSVFGVASSATTNLVTRSAQAGQNISTVARIACNTATGGSLFFNGAGLLFQGFSMYERYRDGNSIDATDALFFAAHIFFFTNAVMNVQFASDLIETTQGRVIDDFQANIRSKRMRKAFNRATNRAETTADVVRFVNTKKDILANMKPSTNASTIASTSVTETVPTNVNARTRSLTFKNGQIEINNIYLLDPRQFVQDVTIYRGPTRFSVGRSTDAFANADTAAYNNPVFIRLKHHLYRLVDDCCNGVKKAWASRVVKETIHILKEMLNVDQPEEMLNLIFNIAVILAKKSQSLEMNLAAALGFLWSYVKANLRNRRANASDESATIYKILYTIVETFEMLLSVFEPAFKTYLRHCFQ